MPRAPGTMPVPPSPPPPPPGGSPSPGRSFFHSFFPSLSAAFREAKRRRLSARARIERFRAETPTRLDSPRVALFTREHSILLSFRQLHFSSSSYRPLFHLVRRRCPCRGDLSSPRAYSSPVRSRARHNYHFGRHASSIYPARIHSNVCNIEYRLMTESERARVRLLRVVSRSARTRGNYPR